MANADGVGEGETVDVCRDSGDAHKCLLDKGQRLRPFAQGKIRFVASGVYIKDQRATAAAVAGATSVRSPSLAASDGSIHPPSWPATARHGVAYGPTHGTPYPGMPSSVAPCMSISGKGLERAGLSAGERRDGTQWRVATPRRRRRGALFWSRRGVGAAS